MTLDQLKPLIIWLHAHPYWTAVIAFVCAFAESIAIIGLIVPGAVIMAAIGILVGAGIAPFGTTVLGAIAGAALGDIISYWLAYRYRFYIRKTWPLRLVPKWFEKGEEFFKRHGGKSIFIGRFVGPIRPIMPLIAGMMQVKPWRFITFDIFSAILWAPAYMLPGILIGTASLALGPDVAKRLIIYLISFLIALWLFYWLIKHALMKLFSLVDRALIGLWQKMKLNPYCQPVVRLIQKAHIPDDHTQLILALTFLICLIAFVLLTLAVIKQYWIMNLNIPVYHFFRSVYNPSIQKIMIVLAYFGSPKTMGLIWFGIVIFLILRRDWFASAHWFLIGCFAEGLAGVLKSAISSPRPIGLEQLPHSWSYPSGHVTLSVAILGILGLFISKSRSYFIRIITYSSIALFVLIIAITRLYLGVHWFTDILGGLLLSLCLVLALALSYRRHPSDPLPSCSLITIALVFLSVGVLWQSFYLFNNDVKNFTPAWPQINIDTAGWWKSGISNGILYRENRFGEPAQILNIQWMGTIKQISSQLAARGWQVRPKNAWFYAITYIGVGIEERKKMIPIWPLTYLDRRPALVMAKFYKIPKKTMVLRLWQSPFFFVNENMPLYVGTISFRRDQSHFFLNSKKHPPVPQNNLSITNLFSQDLPANSWKRLAYPEIERLNIHDDLDWDGYVLLIKS